jgi:Zn-dependent protease with chaperone function
MIYVWHHVATLVLAAGAVRWLGRARWTHRSPHLGVLLWQAAAFSAFSGAVGLFLSAGLAPYGRGIVPALGALAADLAAGAAPPGLTALHVVAVAAGLLLTAAALAVQLRSSWELRRDRARQHLLLRLVGRAGAGDALVLDHPAATAYYLPGASGCVVVSTGALRALSDGELAAVLAHEHTHARERHHVVLAPFHALRRALPWRPFVGAAAAVELLVEMCADDRAARRHGRAAVAAALRRFSELGGRPAPPGALAAADRATALRIARLRDTRPPLRPAVRCLAVLAALTVATTPLSLFLLPA